MKDYYKILDVPKTASPEEIKQAYKRLAKIYHPDANKTGKPTEDRFAEINEAYSVLSDTGQRKKYDSPQRQWSDGKSQPAPSNNDINSVLQDFEKFKF